MEIIIKNLEEIPNSDLEAVAAKCLNYLGDKIHQILFWHMGKTMEEYEGGGSIIITTNKAIIVGDAYNYDDDLEAITLSLYLDEKEIQDVQKVISLIKTRDKSGKPYFRSRVDIDSYRAFEKVLEAMSKIKSL